MGLLFDMAACALREDGPQLPGAQSLGSRNHGIHKNQVGCEHYLRI